VVGSLRLETIIAETMQISGTGTLEQDSGGTVTLVDYSGCPRISCAAGDSTVFHTPFFIPPLPCPSDPFVFRIAHRTRTSFPPPGGKSKTARFQVAGDHVRFAASNTSRLPGPMSVVRAAAV
jgi:hypothetical protein